MFFFSNERKRNFSLSLSLRIFKHAEDEKNQFHSFAMKTIELQTLKLFVIFFNYLLIGDLAAAALIC